MRKSVSRVGRIGAGHQQQAVVWHAVEERAHQAPADARTARGLEHADADEFEVPAQPGIRNVGAERLARVVRPPPSRQVW